MKRTLCLFVAPLALAAGLHDAALARVTGEAVERTRPDTITVVWTDTDPVDVYLADSPRDGLGKARLVAAKRRDGRIEIPAAPAARPYVLLRDGGDGTVARVAERVLPLQQGSNFRDLGGYAGAGGKHVRWGRIYRSGATAMLTDADVAMIRGLGLKEVVDLRTSEERVLAPTRIDGVRYTAVGYSMGNLMGGQAQPPQMGDARMHDVYRGFPTLLAPQLRILFRSLIEGDGAVEFNCSAGQDRTGFASALILTALGVPRETVLADYHLSTTYRRPQNEMPKFDAATIASNPTAAYFASFQDDPRARQPQPLFDSAHKPLLGFALDEVEARWGSVEAYLDKELGVSAADIAKLRAEYLE